MSLSGFFGGALGGAGIGSGFGPIGTIAGGLLGGLGGLFGGGKEKKPKLKQLPTLSPLQQQVLNAYLSQAGAMGGTGGTFGMAQRNLSDLLSPDSQAFDRFSAPLMQQFQEEILPGIAERFAAGAPGGALSSSGFAQALGGAGARLQTQLAALRESLRQQAGQTSLDQYNRMVGLGLGVPSFALGERPGSPSFGQSLLTSVLGGMSPGSISGIGQSLGGLRNFFG
jgi:hypothetical protein